MFGKHKEQVSGNAMDKVVGKIGTPLERHLREIQSFRPEEIRDDGLFEAKVVKPALLAVVAATSGANKLVSGFDERFSAALRHVRDELVRIDGEQVSLADDYAERLPEVLKAGFARPVA
ncbi:hypothetical protein B1C78_02635 [Thioalkalivibrio denitrificans]|uniref:Uncharacterized protein n=1 Tax=Thioalkalivibrio denitrificans TaxID=108003 RepID=A0A1V3NS94_9GAMM|nr:hypothetical protein [Thioalkalivibrio denitrificans]OOG27884.1 hypothetical protein B1C78_02635 [Thioalkalivibrio denitrificans]